jgi:5-(carboxyamino)imidazole ribonucleotide synthase
MLLQAAVNYPVETFVLENDPACPAAHLCHHFMRGEITDFDTVYAFGKKLDALTIEIEHVNVEALEQLEKEGLSIYPRPSVLRIIKNKIVQKEYYSDNSIPTAEYVVAEKGSKLNEMEHFLPFVQKKATGGYDGKGVQLFRQSSDLLNAWDESSVIEKLVPIEKEIAQMVAINEKGETAIYPAVEMMFDPYLNLLDYQLCPAKINEKTKWKAEAISLAVVRNFNSPGIFAVEMFVDKNGEVLVNETAPRVHNSGHHSIEAHYSSQFDMLWRIMLGYPLGNTDVILPSIMVNIVGAPGFSGEVYYEGLEEVLKIEDAFVHLYGKKETRPGRKMGHVTIISKDNQELIHQSNKIKHLLIAKTL